MSIKTTEAKLYYTLYDFFEAEGFQLLMQKKQFRKSTTTGFTNIIFSVSEYDDEAWVEVHIGCRNHQIEQMAQQFIPSLPIDFREDANTLIISTGRYNDVKYFRYKIQNDDDLKNTCDAIMDFMNLSGWTFFKSVTKVADIDRILNSQPHKPSKYLYNQEDRCFKGLIAAKLNHNPHFDRLIEIYQVYLQKQVRDEIELHNYQKLVSFLQYYNDN
ncbi:hypothetical protein P1X15_14350 [Runella sp. MFBS21]|uniref:hypothetical protein n=1 Tax=Runella sp. MFBS21 TaxID=3034018 RepID=UPI0023F62A68|nr:hypothetical protein [Runella sp. MFBS21]MDF7818793.1 hypothetical protein [Runella sp. MFBS21]